MVKTIMKSVPKTCEDCLDEFSKALDDLWVLAQKAHAEELNPVQAREMIVDFEVAHELALKVMEKYFERHGRGPFSGSRDLTVEAFHAELIHDGKSWLDMIIDRIKYNPVYDLEPGDQLLKKIEKNYVYLFHRFEENMRKIL
ncbi:nucleotidyltransferase substrate binding protein [Algoriphagus sediminis]|uniref:Nucleotidyltransferase substrate binding protein n=1 Tax=Algoriphagus sediminis TaxID=3057113 RepID=A0ABT7YGF2_9BACT|nr:nucleotidyltransferase substrate binding protein [Algoriphagus sediminis]MDN3205556.1 nucleotidyltransferase substrate binding protein [Algoriphagus sediminis]